jgi:hypothetical protein
VTKSTGLQHFSAVHLDQLDKLKLAVALYQVALNLLHARHFEYMMGEDARSLIIGRALISAPPE